MPHLLMSSWLGSDSAARWLLNLGLVLTSIGAAAAFMSESLEANREARPKRTLTLGGAFLGAVGTGLASFGISTVGDGAVGYIPTMILGAALVAAFILYRIALRQQRATAAEVVTAITTGSPRDEKKRDAGEDATCGGSELPAER